MAKVSLLFASSKAANWRSRLVPTNSRGSITYLATLAGVLISSAVTAAVFHVKPAGNDAFSGASWAAAKQNVTNTLASAANGDEIWVSAGRYVEKIIMKDGVALYGGFAGTETVREQRDWTAHPTILDGTNKWTVIDISGCGPTTILDGFTIRYGKGPGIRCFDTRGVIRNNFIHANLGDSYGGGISVSGGPAGAAPVIEHNRIIDNYAGDGGGIACIDASPRIANNVFAWNTAQQNGGAISCWRNSSPRIEGNVITGNSASWVADTAVPVGGGGIFATADDLDGRPRANATSAPVIINNVIAANGGKLGGGIAVVDSNGGVPVIANNTVVANNGSGIYWGSSALEGVSTKPIIFNNIVAFNPWGLEMAKGTPLTPNIAFNCVYANTLHGKSGDYQGLPHLTGVYNNISVDPQLTNFKFGNVHLRTGSPCIDAGKIPEDGEAWLDVDQQKRVVGNSIDIGADEFDGTAWDIAVPVLHVRPDGNDFNNGNSWNTARRTIQAAIDAAKITGAEVWVAGGTYREHIVLPAFVYLYGGFAGTETLRASRVPGAAPSVLDGQAVIQVVSCRNSGYLVSALEGFTIQNGGNYTGGSLNKYGKGGLGGGIHIGVASPFISNNLVTHNGLAFDNSPTVPQPASYGAGLYCYLSFAEIRGNIIRENEILNEFDGSGGGIYCDRSSPLIHSNVISENHAAYGAAIYGIGSAPHIVGNLIQSNAMYNTYPLPLYFGSQKGAITLNLSDDLLIERNTIQANIAAVGAAICVDAPQSGRIQNNLITGNRAYDPTSLGGMGGGIYCFVGTNATDNIYIIQNTIVSNIASAPFVEQGGAIAFTLAPPADKLVIGNNILAHNSSGIFQSLTMPMTRPTLLHNDLFNTGNNYINLPSGSSDLARDPQFENPDAGIYTLQSKSPCVDAGSNFPDATSDRNGIPRPLDGDNDGVAAADIGAFEFVHAAADTDSDTMPDQWELANGLNPTTNDAASDLDGDGANNLNEFIAGTNPESADSVLKLTATLLVPSDHILLSWPSVALRTYSVESTVNVAVPYFWQALATDLSGDGTILKIEDAQPRVASRFYRVRVQLIGAASLD